MTDKVPVGYAGFVTRAVALGVDALLINLVAAVTGALISVVDSLLGGAGKLSTAEAVVGGAVWFLWSGAYFVTFWTLTGQTPGARLLGFRVLRSTGGTIEIRRAIRRFVAMLLSLIPFGAGFLPVLVDDRRRGLHDRIAGTVTRWDEAQAAELGAAEPAPAPAPELGQAPPAPAGLPEVPVAPIRASRRA
jgi:uncharacterized RDD family membrane protein YckC